MQRYEGDICPVITYVTIVTLWTAVTCFNILQRCAPGQILFNSERTVQRRMHVVLMPIRMWSRLSILIPFLIRILRYPSIKHFGKSNFFHFFSQQCQYTLLIFLVSVIGVIIFNYFVQYSEIFWKKESFDVSGPGSAKMIPIRADPDPQH
jgi:hypothetical protein